MRHQGDSPRQENGSFSPPYAHLYDAFNRLIGRTLDADGSAGTGDIAQSVYAYDADQMALQFDSTYANGSATDLAASNLSHRYAWNSQAVDQLFADEKVTSLGTAGSILWALTDHQNSVRDLATYDSGTDATTIANHRVYDSFGNLKSETNAAVDCLFGYTGRQFDEKTGLQNNLNRWYDASTGRWISQDPIGFNSNDANLYRYVFNSPTNYIDPSGLAWYSPFSTGAWYNPVKVPANVIGGIVGIGAGIGDALGTLFGPSSAQLDIKILEINQRRTLNNGTLVDEIRSQQLMGAPEAKKQARILGEASIHVTAAGLGGAVITRTASGVAIRNSSLAGKNHPVTNIPFDECGFPDFSSVSLKTVRSGQTGNRTIDAAAANRAAGLAKTPDGYRWHHHQDGTTMQLVPKDIHEKTGHTGGVAACKRP